MPPDAGSSTSPIRRCTSWATACRPARAWRSRAARPPPFPARPAGVDSLPDVVLARGLGILPHGHDALRPRRRRVRRRDRRVARARLAHLRRGVRARRVGGRGPRLVPRLPSGAVQRRSRRDRRGCVPRARRGRAAAPRSRTGSSSCPARRVDRLARARTSPRRTGSSTGWCSRAWRRRRRDVQGEPARERGDRPRGRARAARQSGALSIRDFSPYGYDERQYCSPGFDLPVGCLMRTPYGEFAEYHTSADDLDFVDPGVARGQPRHVPARRGVLETEPDVRQPQAEGRATARPLRAVRLARRRASRRAAAARAALGAEPVRRRQRRCSTSRSGRACRSPCSPRPRTASRPRGCSHRSRRQRSAGAARQRRHAGLQRRGVLSASASRACLPRRGRTSSTSSSTTAAPTRRSRSRASTPSRDTRIRVIISDEFVSADANANRALRQIDPAARYVKVVHGDDWLFPTCLEKMVALAEAHPRVGLVSAYRRDGDDIDLTGLPAETHGDPRRGGGTVGAPRRAPPLPLRLALVAAPPGRPRARAARSSTASTTRTSRTRRRASTSSARAISASCTRC